MNAADLRGPVVFPGLPHWRSLQPEAFEAWRFERGFYEKAFRAPVVLQLTHGGCMDGAACEVLVRRRYGDNAVHSVGLEPSQTLEVLELLTHVPSRARLLEITDLSIQRGTGERVLEALTALSDEGWRISWRDHHHKQWEDAPLDAMGEVADMDVDFSGSECGASLVQKALLPDDAFAQELAQVVRDHDLWLRQDPRSELLQNSFRGGGAGEWVQRLLRYQSLEDPRLARWAMQESKRKARLVKWGLRHSIVVDAGAGKVGVAYGRVPTNEVLHSLEERGCDLNVLLKPTGTFSLRSRRGMDVCHLVAQQFGGGGHPNASGGKLDIGGGELPRLWVKRWNHPKARKLVEAARQAVAAEAQGKK